MNRIYLYANLTDDEAKIVDRIAEELGYTNRTDIITSLLQSLIYGKKFRDETEEINNVTTFAEQYRHLREEFMTILEEYAFPVVAMHGADYAFKALKEDLKAWMYEKCGAVPQESDMKEWVRLYYAINKGKILSYRVERMTESYKEDCKEE